MNRLSSLFFLTIAFVATSSAGGTIVRAAEQGGDAPAETLLLPYFEVDVSEEATAPVLPANTGMASVTGDVDLYDVPGGKGKIIGMLRVGQTVPFGGCKKSGWCSVKGRGWVWGEFLDH